LVTKHSSRRKTAAKALRKRLSALTKELGHVLSDNDERWHTFGLTSPAERLANRRSKAKAKKAAAGGEESPKNSAKRATSPAPAERAETTEGAELNS
jgi:uncharacterized protein YdaU (DUF1376 family)